MAPRIFLNSRASRGHGGVVATELALVVPVLLVLGLACADFGRVAHFQQIVSNSARTAADIGATRQFTNFTRAAWEAEIYRAAMDELANTPGFDEADVTYSLSTTTDGDGITWLAVIVELPFRTVCQWPGFPSEVILRARIEARQFR